MPAVSRRSAGAVRACRMPRPVHPRSRDRSVRSSGQRTRKMAPPPGASSARDAAAMGVGDAGHDGQTQTRAAFLGGLEGREQVVPDFRLDARPVVGDHQFVGPAPSSHQVQADLQLALVVHGLDRR